MTSEIALLNRSAVALAADSAVTVTYWENGSPKTRYFKGANKLFHLSATHPIGMMIYASADLQGVPWEVLAKAYRDHLENNAHDKLADYAKGFFEYVLANGILFPMSLQEEQFKSDVQSVSGRILVNILSNERYTDLENDDEKFEKSKELIAEIESQISSSSFVGNADQSDIDDASAKYLNEIEGNLEKSPFFAAFSKTMDIKSLARLGIAGLFKVGFSSLSDSGIVFAGFGETEFFPRLISYTCHGIVLGKLIYEEAKNNAITISQENSSAVVPFAQDEMIQTFMFGVSMPGLVQLDEIFVSSTKSLVNDLVDKGQISKDADVDEIAKHAKEIFAKETLNYFVEAHTTPLRRAVGMLSISELAELAETLISLESLKERVTRPSDSVSGPIDVAVISKSDGFIWMKRKHYFKPELNPRYFARKNLHKGT